MSNYIDRKALLREMEELYNKRAVDAYMTGDKEIRVSWNDAVYLVTVAPTVEAEPVKHGRWLPSDKGDGIYTCSECGFVRDAYVLEEKAFCPHCGAPMDE